jgi:hypothetical protein
MNPSLTVYVCHFFILLSPLANIVVPKPGESQQASHWSPVLLPDRIYKQVPVEQKVSIFPKCVVKTPKSKNIQFLQAI